MVTVAQLVEPWTVTPVVAGSNPVSHPIFSKRSPSGLICKILKTFRGFSGLISCLLNREALQDSAMAQPKVKTLDGTRTTVADLNIAAPHALQQRQQGIWGQTDGGLQEPVPDHGWHVHRCWLQRHAKSLSQLRRATWSQRGQRRAHPIEFACLAWSRSLIRVKCSFF